MAAHTVTAESPESSPWWLNLSEWPENCPKWCTLLYPLVLVTEHPLCWCVWTPDGSPWGNAPLSHWKIAP